MMENVKKKICRLCLQTEYNDDFREIDSSSKEILNKLWKPNLGVSKEPVMCTNCLENLQKSLEIKATCLSTEDFIISFIKSETTSRVNLRQIYLRENTTLMKIPEDQNVCRFCLKLKEGGCFKTVIEAQERMFFQNMLLKFIPGLDLTNTEDPVICDSCQINFAFMINWFDVEEKIKRFCEVQGTDINCQVELDAVLRFSLKNEDNVCATGIVKKEEWWDEICELPEIEQFVENEDLNVYIKNEGTCIKSAEIRPVLENSEINIQYGDTEIKPEESDYKSFQFSAHSELPIQDDKGHFVNVVGDTNNDVGEISNCESEENDKTPLMKERGAASDNVPATVSNKCETCGYEAKSKHTLNQHRIIHKNFSEIKTHKCEMCEFVTKRKNTLNRHMLVHKCRSEITMFKCEMCTFETKLKSSLNRHLLIHKDPSEAMCKYEIGPKEPFIKYSSIIDEISSEIIIYKCKMCAYETKFKETLKRHMLVHKNPSELKMYRCVECFFETKHRGSLRHHMLIHKNPSEIRMFKCKMCVHQTKNKSDFNRHLLIHKNPSELTMYKCDLCNYETKQKRCLNRHMVTHKSTSQTVMYQCENCTFQTKYKRSVVKHMKTHNKSSSISK